MYEEGVQFYPKLPNTSVNLSSSLLQNTVDISGRETLVLVYTGASVSIIKNDQANTLITYMDKRIQVQGFDGKKMRYEEWTTVTVGFQGQSIEIAALVIAGVDY